MSTDIWAQLSAPLPSADISWRQDGKASARDGKFFARFVCFVESNTIRNRLDSVVPGEWDCTLEMLPERPDSDGVVVPAFKARLQVRGVIRENVGTGKDYKTAATDAFKRAAVHFGIGAELYDYEQNWVQVDSDGKYPKVLEDPQHAYERRYGSGKQNANPTRAAATPGTNGTASWSATSSTRTATTSGVTGFDPDVASCPKCGGAMFDNRLTKRNPKAPDHKCKDKSCDGVIWPPKDGAAKPTTQRAVMDADDYVPPDEPPADLGMNDLPF